MIVRSPSLGACDYPIFLSRRFHSLNFSRIQIPTGSSGTDCNRPFPRSLVPLFESESKCETILMKMTLICMKMKLHAELIFIRKVSHLDSFSNRGTRELGNGLLQARTNDDMPT